ncbi:hypothetical protein GGS26DRAFT_252260 [Hypomontagnella submonticulosa]|nr:hypothetical protein GGS26DRAFT_252260 [Hypomontagnella submonticulosa]
MAPFALAVPGYRFGIHSRKRKTDEEQDNEDIVVTESEWDTPSSHLPSDSINPLSHSPDTLRQLAVAGLEPTDEVPSKAHPLFPHKPLPSEGKRRKGRGTENADEKSLISEETTPKPYSERLKHLSTMTAILHRCLADGDITRAKRAFSLLVQTKDIDIRLGGLWAVGSKILMRDGEAEQQQSRQRQQRAQTGEEDIGSDEEDQSHNGNANDEQREGEVRRWGLAANIEKVTLYFEALTQQYPHDPYRPQLTSALDFWPALFGIEIYNLDAEHRRALRQLQVEEEERNEESELPFEDEDMDLEREMEEDPDVDPHDAFDARRRRREEARQAIARAARDELRSEMLGAAERIAQKMDRVMENAPYSSHRELLRLRGHLALYVGDLCLASRLTDEDGVVEGQGEDRNVEDMLRSRAESTEEHAALVRRSEEHDRARACFRKILEGGGELDAWVLKFVNADEDEADVNITDGW